MTLVNMHDIESENSLKKKFPRRFNFGHLWSSPLKATVIDMYLKSGAPTFVFGGIEYCTPIWL